MDKKLLKQLKERCCGLCEQCGSPGDWRGLAAHHKQFRSQGGEDSLENLIVLCGSCHSKSHHIVERL